MKLNEFVAAKAIYELFGVADRRSPESNKPGWGTGNYTSQRTPAWKGYEGGFAQGAEEIYNAIQKGEVNFDAFKAWLDQYGHKVTEAATAGATSSANIATIPNPQLSPGKARGKKSFTGSPGKSGTKAPPQPKAVQPKTANGTAKNGLDMKGSIFGGPMKR